MILSDWQIFNRNRKETKAQIAVAVNAQLFSKTKLRIVCSNPESLVSNIAFPSLPNPARYSLHWNKKCFFNNLVDLELMVVSDPLWTLALLEENRMEQLNLIAKS